MAALKRRTDKDWLLTLAAPVAPFGPSDVVDDVFVGGGVTAKSVRVLTIRGNRFTAPALPLQTTACTEVVVEGNHLGVTP